MPPLIALNLRVDGGHKVGVVSQDVLGESEGTPILVGGRVPVVARLHPEFLLHQLVDVARVVADAELAEPAEQNRFRKGC